MQRSDFLVSVIVPVYNSQQFVTEAIDSIMAQHHEEVEIVIVDDGSTDSTETVVRSVVAPIRYYKQENRGPSAARNVGIRHAEGDIIAFLDADDLWPPDKLHLQLSRLRDDPELDIVLGRVQYTGELNEVERNLKFEKEDQTVMNVNLGCGLFRREVFEKVGLFAEDLRHFEDHDWFLRAREAGVRMTILPETTLLYRRHEDSTTNVDGVGKNMLPILKRSLDRRRRMKDLRALPKFFDYDDTESDTGHTP